jgi:hypothetical protein
LVQGTQKITRRCGRRSPAERKIAHDRLDKLVDNLVGARQLLATTSRLAVDAHAHPHLVVAKSEEASRKCHRLDAKHARPVIWAVTPARSRRATPNT